ncbi:TonB-dependent receptor [Algoriphagus aestuarii]|nr:TonB-dependent receptor [Algoriphagus aestuarii]
MKMPLIAFLMMISVQLKAQQMVSGVVTSGDDGLPLPGVTIIVKGSTSGTATNLDGKYSIQATPDDVLVFSFIGFTSQEIVVGNQKIIDLTMQPDVGQLDEIVVVGYGEVKKSDLTGAVSIVSSDDLGDRSATSVAGLLQGRAAGVDVTGGQIRIRGTNSISSGTDPLYVIDGLLGGDPNVVHPSDIETIEVLKDAGSTAIYGSRGANGVIIITTKKGKTGAPQISYNNFFGSSTPSRQLDLLNSLQYMELLNDIEVNGANGNFDFTTIPKLYNPDGTFTEYAITDRTDWQDEMTQTAPFSEHNLSLRGATDLVTYSVSGAYNNTKSTYGTSQWENYKFGLNTEWKLFNGRLKLGEDFRGQSWNNEGRGVDFLGGMRMPTYSPIEDPNALGGFAYVTTTDDLNDATNPITDLRLSDNKSVGANFTLNLKADLQIIEGLNLRSSFGIFGGYSGNFSYIRPRQNGNLVFPLAQLDESSNYSLPSQTILENYLTYKKSFEDHAFTALIGNTVLKSGWNRGISAQGKGYLNDEIKTLNVADERTVNSQWINAFAKLSYFGRVSYSFKEKYFIDANLRFDGSDSFAPNNRWGSFPAFNVGWKISDEEFLRSSNSVSFLKLRAGYGITGNDAIPQYAYFSNIHNGPAYAFPTYTALGTNGKTINAAFNPAIQWEEVAALNVGMDFGFLDDRLMLNVDYFSKETRQMLVDVPLPPSLGFGGNGGGGNATINAANLTNKGVELFLTAKDAAGDFSYTITANATFQKNEVTNLSNGIPYNDGGFGFMSSNRTEVGQPVGYLYGFKMDHVYATQEQVDADNDAARDAALAADPSLTPEQLAEIFYISSATRAGDIRFIDLDNNGLVNDDDRTYLGNSQPTFMYGLATTLGYKGFDFFMNWTGREGNSIVYGYGYWMEGMIRPFNSSTATLDRWKSESEPGNGMMPRAVKTDPSGNLRMSDRFVYSGAFLRLSLVSLGYSFSRDLLDRAFNGSVQKLRVYVSSDNLVTFSNYPGLNPEVGGWSRGRGVDNGTLPVSRTFRAGLQLSL